MSFDGFFLHHMVDELQSELLNGRIQKINQPFEQELVLQIRSNRKNQKLCFWTDPTDPDQLRESCLPQYLYHGHAQVSPRGSH